MRHHRLPGGGSVEFDGQPLTNRSPYDIVDAGITMIPEGRQLFPHFTVRDNLLMGSYKRAARPGPAQAGRSAGDFSAR